MATTETHDEAAPVVIRIGSRQLLCLAYMSASPIPWCNGFVPVLALYSPR